MRYRAAALALLLATPVIAADLRTEVSGHRAGREPAIVGQLDQLIRMRSIAADPAGLSATAAHLEDLLKARGFQTASWSTGNMPPVVFGFLKSPGARHTVVFYAH